MCKRPNIFDFATSELSQDAFICWLVSWVGHHEAPDLERCAREFVVLLYNTYHKTNKNSKAISSDDVDRIQHLKQQYNHIDVYFQAIIKGKKEKTVSFIIEDKTHTSQHSGQLERYREIIRKDKYLEDETVLIYFKTGFLYPPDYEVIDDGYCIIDYKIIHKFLQSQDVKHPIYQDYQEYIADTFFKPYEENITTLLSAHDFELFKRDHVQWQYLEKLKIIIEDDGGCRFRLGKGDNLKISHGKNRDGSSWSELHVVFLNDCYPDNIAEQVFYRLDRRKNSKSGKNEYYLSLRQYGQVKDFKNEERKVQQKRKLKRLKRYREISDEAKSSTQHGLKFSPPRGDWSGANESEIAILFFDKKINPPQLVLDEIPRIHAEFIKRLEADEFLSLGKRGGVGTAGQTTG